MQRHDVVLRWNSFSTKLQMLKTDMKRPLFLSPQLIATKPETVNKISNMRQTKYFVTTIHAKLAINSLYTYIHGTFAV